MQPALHGLASAHFTSAHFPDTHFGAPGGGHVGQGAASTTQQFGLLYAASRALSPLMYALLMATPHTPTRPQLAPVSSQSASDVQLWCASRKLLCACARAAQSARVTGFADGAADDDDDATADADAADAADATADDASAGGAEADATLCGADASTAPASSAVLGSEAGFVQ